MALVQTKGLVVRVVNYGERDRILTVLTEDFGLITVMANGSRTLKSRALIAAEQFCYSQYILFHNKDKYTLREVELIESFFDIRADIERMALAGYLCEVVSHVGTENNPDIPLLRLTLNALYAISSGKYPLWQIKGSFEMRAAAILGFMPALSSCAACGEEGEDTVLDVMNGVVICEKCRNLQSANDVQIEEQRESNSILCLLRPAARAALYYTIECPLERILSFRLDDPEEQKNFSYAAETYLINQLEFGFKTLDFYKTIISIEA
ncbi:MAG: DNA repair protein RecO [Clostridia bacterium]|nr:DNA repair protein RecO [Clostridia bacterium]